MTSHDNVTDIGDRLNETVVCYLACMEDRDMHCSRILEGAREITALREQLAKAIEAGTVETERLDAQHESAGRKALPNDPPRHHT